MRKIFKYEIEPSGITDVRMPVGSVLLGVDYHPVTPVLWAKINLRAHECIRRVVAVPTGMEITMSMWQAPLVGVLQRNDFTAHVLDMGEMNL